MPLVDAASTFKPSVAPSSQPTTTVSQPVATPPDQSVGACSELETDWRKAANPLHRCRSAVRLARCIILTECAPLLSAELYHSGEARAKLTQRADGALKLLDEAASALDEKEPDSDELRQRIELLRTFAKLFAALADSGDTSKSKDQLVEACVDLSPFVDDPDKAVAESARFWQGVAYRRAGRPDRALQVLRPVLAEPVAGRIGFFARLERCRALAEKGDHVAALALVIRLSARVESWFEEDSAQARTCAADTVRFLRVELLEDWAVKLRAAGQATPADDALAAAKKLLGRDAYPPPPDRRLVLTESNAGVPEIELSSETK